MKKVHYTDRSHDSLVDDPRPDQANTVITADLIDKVEDLVRSQPGVKLRMLAVKVDVSIGTMWAIVHDRLRYRKVCAQWDPKQLTAQHKELRLGLTFQYLFGIMKTLLFWSGSSRVKRAGAITTSQRQSGTAYSGSIRHHFPLKSSKPLRQ
ncbi:hypothetical protein HNY73_002513 [Argiope bruennichi]|uniref:Transposase n=1 Tax=Argiope bruennichi TaxID=94029 RepID=A0A8T0FY59_ARGBR|nr:hypothetical protein HNY73_002513 [Argiope bruennichi]